MNKQIITDILIWGGIGLAILLAIVGISETIFGDLTTKDSLLPLAVIVPVLVVVIVVFRYFWKKK